ncbi:hypothetical protein KJ554_03280, partial [bacterium]|nr:hypothetical protein [bacterium]
MRTLTVSLLCLALPAAAAAIPISDLHQNYANGTPALLDQTVTVSGVVTVPTYLLNGWSLEVFVQDETGGINVFVSGGASSWNLALDDSVTVTSRVAFYNGLTELGTDTSYTTITNHGPAASPPDPQLMTCAEVAGAMTPSYWDPDESRLVRLDGLNVAGGTWPTAPGGNTVLTISDGGGSCLLYIDQDTDVNGSPDPGADFSVIGVIKQYDTSSPYTSGYEVMPRYSSDVIPAGAGPIVLGKATLMNITTTSAYVVFITQDDGSSEVEYGPDAGYGQTAGYPDIAITFHIVQLTGLTPNTVYHFRAKSANEQGVSYGPDQLLATPSDTPGEIHVYMKGSADHGMSYDGLSFVNDNESLSSRLVDLVDDAEASVDACLYSFSLDNVRDALIAAHNRGCLVRIIIDQDNSTYDADVCAAAGIPYITSGFGGNHASGAMHNKFVVVDGRDADKYDDWTWTGSANMSVSGDGDLNNAVAIRDYGLAQAYTIEFNEMWGSDTQTASAAAARMGDAKLDDTPHEFTINGIRVEQYMSPTDAVTQRVVEAVQSAEQNVYFAMLAFTHDDISDAMRARRAAVPDLGLAGVFEQDQGDCASGSEYWRMHGDACAPDPWSPPADVWLDTALSTSVLLHHKYLLIDTPGSPMTSLPDKDGGPFDSLVLTGSHNWSYSAESVNDENTLVIHDYAVANLYLQEFAARYAESGGTGFLGWTTGVEDGADASPRLVAGLRAWPNPFNPQLNLSFTTARAERLDVTVHDARGRLVRSLARGEDLAAGLHVLGWDGRGEDGRPAASGAYFLRV